jgi:hypothetical protein
MKRSRNRTAAIFAFSAAAAITGCSSSQDSPSSLAGNEAMTVSSAPARQSRPRGLLYASDTVGQAIFSDTTPAMASVPERE